MMRTKRMRMVVWPMAAVFGLAMGGCDEAVAPEADGASSMEVGVRGDGSAAAGPSRSESVSGGSRETAASSGRIDVEARVYVRAAGGGWVELTSGTARQTVDASGSDGVRVLATSAVQARTYRQVRVEFERVEAAGSGSIQIGSGLTASVRVDGGSDGQVVVERDLTVQTRTGATSRLEIDLNADQWMGRASAGSVSEAEFRQAVLITAS